MMKRILTAVALVFLAALPMTAQKYQNGLVDRSVAVIGGELISLSVIEAEVQMMSAQGLQSDRNARCEVLENLMCQKLFLMQARVDSLKVNQDLVQGELSQRLANVKTALGGDAEVEEYFGKSMYRLRQDWEKQLEENSLTQQEQQQIASAIPPLTPADVRDHLDTVDASTLPIVPIKYKMSEICIYPDREAAKLAVKEKLLEIRERILGGEKFATLARLYSEDPGSSRKGGELGMASRSIFWPAFSDAAMALKVGGSISQIVETPDGFHIIEVLEKKGDMFNARHILMKPKYTADDREKAFKVLDSLRTKISEGEIDFEVAARFYSENPATRTNGGQMADPMTGSAYFEIDQLKPQDYAAVKGLEEGGISEPIESLDNEGRDGNLVYKIVRLDKIVPAHTASFENDYSELQAIVQQNRQHEAIDKFINEKIAQTYIIIDPIFKDCQFERAGWESKFREK